MTPAEHYRAGERVLEDILYGELNPSELPLAQAHFTAALVGATILANTTQADSAHTALLDAVTE